MIVDDQVALLAFLKDKKNRHKKRTPKNRHSKRPLYRGRFGTQLW